MLLDEADDFQRTELLSAAAAMSSFVETIVSMAFSYEIVDARLPFTASIKASERALVS